MKIHTSIIGLLILGGTVTLKAQAQESPPLITDRPDFTESSQTVPAGMVQIEAGVTYERSGNARQTTAGETLIRVAAGSSAEIRIGVPSYLSSRDGGRATGFDDSFLGAKLALSAHNKHPLALLVGTTLPTGSRRVAPHKIQPEASLATEFDLAKRLELAVNIGAGRPNDGDGAFSQYFGSASLGFDLSEQVGTFAEVYAFNRTERGGNSQKFIDGGFTYALKPELQLDARVGFGLHNDVDGPDYFYGIGVSQRF